MRFLLLLLCTITSFAQHLEFRQIKHEWPKVELKFFTDCDKGDFRVRENGKDILNFTMSCDSIYCNISTSLVFDVSGSMDVAIKDEIEAGITFLTSLDSLDEAAIITFNQDVRLLHPITRDKQVLIDTLKTIFAEGGTALWDGVYQGITEIMGRKCNAVIVLSDGYHNSGNKTLWDVIVWANHNGIPVYTIGLGLFVDEPGLWTLAQMTGGKYYRSPSSADLVDIYKSILKELTKPECTITYEIDCPDGTLRTVDLELVSCGWAMQTKQYIAHLDTSIFKSAEVLIRDTTLYGGDTLTIPLKLSRDLPIRNGKFSILSCGEIIPHFGVSNKIPGGCLILSDTLGSITIITPETDTLCLIEIVWETEGCVNPIRSRAYLSLIKRRPILSCSISLIGDTATILVRNTGTGKAEDVKLWADQLVLIGDVSKTATYSWYLEDTCVYVLSRNYPTISCCVTRPKRDTVRIDTIPPPRKIFCRATATDSTVTVFTDSAWVYILQSQKFISIPPSVKFCNDSVVFQIKRVAKGRDTIRVIAEDGVSTFCEVILDSTWVDTDISLQCSPPIFCKLGDEITVILTLGNTGQVWSGNLIFVGAKKVTGYLNASVTIGSGQIVFYGKAIQEGEDTLLFRLGDKECRVPIKIVNQKPKFDIKCLLTASKFYVTIYNTGIPDTAEVFIQVPPGVGSDYPIKRIYVRDSVTLEWNVSLPKGQVLLKASLGKVHCESRFFTPPERERYLACDAPDTLYQPGVAQVFAWGDSIITLVPNGYRVLSEDPWMVYFDKTCTILFIQDTMRCEKTVVVLNPKVEYFCKIFAPDTVDSVVTITAEVGGLEYVTLAVNAEYLTPPTTKNYSWTIKFQRYYQDTTIIAYLPFCQKKITVRGRPLKQSFSLPDVVGMYGEKIHVPMAITSEGQYSVQFKYDNSIVKFLHISTPFAKVVEDTALTLTGTSPYVVFVFEGITKSLAQTNLTFKREMGTYQDGRITISGDCIIPLNDLSFDVKEPTYISGEIIDMLGRKIYQFSNFYSAGEYVVPISLPKGIYFFRINSRVTKIIR